MGFQPLVLIVLFSVTYSANSLCGYGEVSRNSEVNGENSTAGITCHHVPEASGATGYYRTVCSFYAFNASDISFEERSLLAEYNELVLRNSSLENETFLVQLVMNHYYCPLIDVAKPSLKSPLITETLLCTDLDGNVTSDQINVEIMLENTQAPEFDYFTYTYDIPDNIESGTDFTERSEIYATDEDNNFEVDPHDPSVQIKFAIEGSLDMKKMFEVSSILVRRDWPYKYRAVLRIVDTGPLYTENFFTFNLIAQNTGDNSLGTITSAEIRINVYQGTTISNQHY